MRLNLCMSHYNYLQLFTTQTCLAVRLNGIPILQANKIFRYTPRQKTKLENTYIYKRQAIGTQIKETLLAFRTEISTKAKLQAAYL